MLLPPTLEEGLKFTAGAGAQRFGSQSYTRMQQGEEWQVEGKNIVWGGALLFLNSHNSAHVTDGCHQQWVLGKER